MCTEILVCHGEKFNYNNLYTPAHQQWWQQHYPNAVMSAPARFYITKDGNYAIDADFIPPDQVQGNFDITNKPKIPL